MEENIEMQPLLEDDVQNLIREQVDYIEERFDKNGYVDYIIESSISIGKKLKTKYNYEEVQGGYACKGVELTIEDF